MDKGNFSFKKTEHYALINRLRQWANDSYTNIPVELKNDLLKMLYVTEYLTSYLGAYIEEIKKTLKNIQENSGTSGKVKKPA